MEKSEASSRVKGRGGPAANDPGIRSARILIVDDEALSRRLLESILRRQNFTCLRTVGDGEAALREVESVEPDLVLLDYEMPDINGAEVCERLRADPRYVDLPILIQTATVDRGRMDVLFAAGASDFLSKPINPIELISRITVHLERRNMLRELRAYRRRTSLELEAARCMQMELLPTHAHQQRTVAAGGVRIGSFLRSSSEIGGDFWGILAIDATSFGVFLADFAGHGVTAALNTFRLHALIHEHRDLHRDPAGLLATLNERLVGMLSPGQYATFCYALIEPRVDRLTFVSAGAPSPIIARGTDGETTIAEAFGLPLGITSHEGYETCRQEFPAGSTLLLFSDGLSENQDASGDRIGDERLRQLLDDHRKLAPEAIIEHLCDAAGVGATDALNDDVTIVCLDRKGELAPDPATRPAAMLEAVTP
jgi:sigma-B regulation protein RsbU (phosphoserine phosphatase)